MEVVHLVTFINTSTQVIMFEILILLFDNKEGRVFLHFTPGVCRKI